MKIDNNSLKFFSIFKGIHIKENYSLKIIKIFRLLYLTNYYYRNKNNSYSISLSSSQYDQLKIKFTTINIRYEFFSLRNISYIFRCNEYLMQIEIVSTKIQKENQ